MTIKKVIREGECLPWQYGYAYRNVAERTYICYPMPLHWPVRWWTSFWWSFGLPKAATRRERALDAAFEAGRKDGITNGRREAADEFMALLNKRL